MSCLHLQTQAPWDQAAWVCTVAASPAATAHPAVTAPRLVGAAACDSCGHHTLCRQRGARWTWRRSGREGVGFAHFVVHGRRSGVGRFLRGQPCGCAQWRLGVSGISFKDLGHGPGRCRGAHRVCNTCCAPLELTPPLRPIGFGPVSLGLGCHEVTRCDGRILPTGKH